MNLYSTLFIENRINTTFETLNNISHKELHRPHEIYNLTTHSTRYSILGHSLNVLSLPLVVISGVVKLFSGGMISINNVINVPKILKDKMDQGISKKILYAVEGIDKQELTALCHNILEQWEANPNLVPTQEESYFTKIKNAMYNNIPYLGQLKNFWVKGGIEYSEKQIKEQQLIKIITNEIFKLGYSLGKKANYLSIEDIRHHFIDQSAFENDDQPQKTQLPIDQHNDDFQDPYISSQEDQVIDQMIDLIDEGFEDAFEDCEEYEDAESIEPQSALTKKPIDHALASASESFEEDIDISDIGATNTDQKYTDQNQALVLYNDELSKVRSDSSNQVDVSSDVHFMTDQNREQVLLNVKKYLAGIIHTNSLLELEDGVDQYLELLQSLNNQELGEKIISDYQLLQSNMQDQDTEMQYEMTQRYQDADILVPCISCRQEALKDERELEGIVEEF